MEPSQPIFYTWKKEKEKEKPYNRQGGGKKKTNHIIGWVKLTIEIP